MTGVGNSNGFTGNPASCIARYDCCGGGSGDNRSGAGGG